MGSGVLAPPQPRPLHRTLLSTAQLLCPRSNFRLAWPTHFIWLTDSFKTRLGPDCFPWHTCPPAERRTAPLPVLPQHLKWTSVTAPHWAVICWGVCLLPGIEHSLRAGTLPDCFCNPRTLHRSRMLGHSVFTELNRNGSKSWLKTTVLFVSPSLNQYWFFLNSFTYNYSF